MLYNEVQLNVELDGNARYNLKCPEELENPGGPLSGVQNFNAVGDSDPCTRLRVVNLL